MQRKKIIALEERSCLLPFCPKGFPFHRYTHTLLDVRNQHSPGLFLPGMMISWQNTMVMEGSVYFG